MCHVYFVICLYCYFRVVVWSWTYWYYIAGIPPPSTFLHFLVITHNRGQLSHFYKPLNTVLAVESTKNDNQPPTKNFETKYFRTMPINWTLTLYFKSERNVSIFVEIGVCLIYTMILGILGNIQLLIS